MSKDLLTRIRRLHGIALSILLIITGICFMAACVAICRSGNQPFSRESVAAAFQSIAFPVYLCLAMILLGFCFPKDEQKPKAPKPAEKQAYRTSTKTVNITRWVIVCAAVALAVYGFCTGGTADVLTKAINICTECVGLG